LEFMRFEGLEDQSKLVRLLNLTIKKYSCMQHSVDDSSLFGFGTDQSEEEAGDYPKGLIVLPESLTPDEIASILLQIPRTHNQTMYFNNIPSFLDVLSTIGVPFLNRNPVFNQAVINVYERGQGLKSHIDLDKFEDGILVCNLIGTVNFAFTRNEEENSIVMNPGDCLIMTGESRSEWKHGFEAVMSERIGVTMRRMKLTGDGYI